MLSECIAVMHGSATEDRVIRMIERKRENGQIVDGSRREFYTFIGPWGKEPQSRHFRSSEFGLHTLLASTEALADQCHMFFLKSFRVPHEGIFDRLAAANEDDGFSWWRIAHNRFE